MESYLEKNEVKNGSRKNDTRISGFFSPRAFQRWSRNCRSSSGSFKELFFCMRISDAQSSCSGVQHVDQVGIYPFSPSLSGIRNHTTWILFISLVNCAFDSTQDAFPQGKTAATYNHLVEYPHHGGGHTLLRDGVAKAAEHRAGANELAPCGKDISIIVYGDPSKIQ